MILLSINRKDRQEENDVLIDAEKSKTINPIKNTFQTNEQLIETVKARLQDLNEKTKTLEQLKLTKINTLEEENEQLKKEIAQLEAQLTSLEEQLEGSSPKEAEDEYSQEVLEQLIYPINTIDQIASAYRNTGEHELVAEQLEKVAELTIQQMATLGIEEIPVYGEELNGDYMESFGPANHVVDETLPPHSVAIVSRRAFKNKETDEIIQHALVYTVPEEN